MWVFFSNPTGGELSGVEKLEGELSRVGKIIREELFGKGIVWIPFFYFFYVHWKDYCSLSVKPTIQDPFSPP